MASRRLAAAALLAVLFAIGSAARAEAQYLVSGNDEKRSWDENGQALALPPGKDTVSIIDIRNRVEPRVIANLPLMNTIAGPPTSLAITPDNRLALIANGLLWTADGARWKGCRTTSSSSSISPPRRRASPPRSRSAVSPQGWRSIAPARSRSSPIAPMIR